MNSQNLIPNSQRTHEELQEMGRKGGIKSGETRRKQREFKKLAKWILEDSMNEFLKGLTIFIGGSEHDE